MCKLTIFLKSGHTVKIKCKQWEFEFNKTTLEYVGYKITGAVETVSFVPSQIAGYIAR